MYNNFFIVFEGLDRAGKTTICNILSEHLSNSVKISFPNRETQTGRLITNFLKSNENYVDPHELHLLFSANRYHEAKKITEILKTNHVICDRYWYSGTCYSVAKGLDFEWCVSLDKYLPKPDIIFFIDIKAEDVIRRPGFGNEVNDSINLQSRVYDAYTSLFKTMDNVFKIDGNNSQILIITEIVAILNRELGLNINSDIDKTSEIINQ